jgi:hypothetical protein
LVKGNYQLPFREAIANAVDRFDHGLTGGGFKFFAEIFDV